MNLNNLNKLIDCYEENFELIYVENDELFKWRAVRAFQKAFKDEINNGKSFCEKFVEAKKEFSVLMDNSRMSPSSGIVKLAEKNERAVEELFFKVLFANDGGDLTVRQNNMEAFGEGIRKLLAEYYPQSWKFNQDRHTVSCYLSLYNPDDNFIYRYTEVERFAKYVEFEKDIGSGGSFRLDVYYEMCQRIKEILETHTSLIKKQNRLLEEKVDPEKGQIFFADEELHLLVFNLIWCSNTYNFFRGMTCNSRKDVLKAYTLEQLKEKVHAQKEAEKAALLEQIEELECQVGYCKAISLIGIQVTEPKTGENGTVVEQNINRIKVKYDSVERSYIISKAFPSRPRFEDDDEIVEMFTEYDNVTKKVKTLKNELKRLEEQSR